MSEEISLTIFLLRPEKAPAFEAALLPSNATIALQPPFEGVFLPLPAGSHIPRWVSIVETILQQRGPMSLSAQSPAGLLVIRRAGKTFVITFGHAWQKLDDQWLEREFGRRVALNMIPRDQVIEVRAEQVFAGWHLANERAPRASALEEFNVETDRDLVAAITGIPKDPRFGKMLRGATSLRITTSLGELPEVLDALTVQFNSDEYKKTWPDIDNVTPISDHVLIDSLELQLTGDLATPQGRRRIVMFTPSQRRDDDVTESYVYGRLSKTPAMSPYLSIEGWVNFLNRTNTTPSVSESKISKIHLMDEHKDELRSCTAFECLGYETTLNGAPYILSSGQWYEVNAEFLDLTNQMISKIPQPALTLPPWDHIVGEPAYNEWCAEQTGYLYFDAKPIYYGGAQSKFEFCDLCDLATSTLFFVKNPSKASGMSHLLEQVRRTAELFFNMDGTYRRELRKVFRKVDKKIDTTWLASRPTNGDWDLCMVSLGRPAKSLPFFAKCGLVRLHRDLTQRGHKVTYASV